MKYKSSANLARKNRARRLRLYLVVLAALLVLGGLFGGIVGVKSLLGKMLSNREVAESVAGTETKEPVVERNRLDRTLIPKPNFVSWGQSFDDLNDVQLESAMRNGLENPDADVDPAHNPELVRIATSDLYVVEEMTHSKPYLVPEAALMLQYIATRFQEVLEDMAHDSHGYRPIVTSALRSREDVERLRRRNRNASENSCHRYGTTIDITYIRFIRDDGDTVNEEWLKLALATALYELRYEGICHVKYEYRQACFHITLRSTEYKGGMRSERHTYREVPAAAPSKAKKRMKWFNATENNETDKKPQGQYVTY